MTNTLGKLREFIFETVRLEASAARAGLLQSIDPRVKLAGLLATLFLVSLAGTLWPIVAVYTAVLVLARLSGLDLRRFLMRGLAPALFFSLPIILPATLNIVTPGPAALTLWASSTAGSLGFWKLPPLLAITYPGLITAARFLLRSLTMLTASMLIVETTPVHRALASLAALRLPNMMIVTLQMVWRYLFVLVGLVNDVHLAKRSRTIVPGAGRAERRWVTGRIGWLLGRSLQMSDDVTAAMIARGFSGRYIALPAPPLTRNDRLAVATLLILLTGLAVAVI